MVPSWKRFVAPAHWGNSGDAGEGGATSASTTSLFVTAVEGALGEGDEGVSWDMVVFLHFFDLLGVFLGGRVGKIRTRAKS